VCKWSGFLGEDKNTGQKKSAHKNERTEVYKNNRPKININAPGSL
jgi:hypothetical protein